MYKLNFFVPCSGWVNGGYENTHYFETKQSALRCAESNHVKVLSLELVSLNEFAEDYIC